MWMLSSAAPDEQLTTTTLGQALRKQAVLQGEKSLYMRPRKGQGATGIIPIFSINAYYADQGLFQITVPSGFGESPSLGCDISHLAADDEVFVARHSL